MKKITPRLTALLLALLLLTAPAAATAHFSDVPASHWAAESIERCAALGILNGTGGGRFGLGEPMSRAAYALALCRLLGWELTTPEQGSYLDNQDPAAWYYSAIETARTHGALTDESTRCRPTEAITREELAKMTIRALGYATLAGILAAADEAAPDADAEGFASLTAERGKNCPFADCTTSQGYIALAYRMGILKGVSRWSFDPKSNATREQAAAVLLRVYDRLHAPLTVTELTADAPPSEAEAVYAHTAASGESAVSPRAALEEVYAAAVRAGEGGSISLTAAPFAQTLRGGKVTGDGKTLASEELAALLADAKTATYRFARYESTRLTHTSRGTTTVVWYEAPADLAAKTTLARLLGLSAVYLQA